MNTLPVTQLFVRASTSRTPSSREAERAAIAAAMASYSGPIEQIPAYQAKPMPPRRQKVDPETRLHRQPEPRIDSRALEVIRRYRWHGAHAIQQKLREIGISMRRDDIEAAGAKHGFWVSWSVT